MTNEDFLKEFETTCKDLFKIVKNKNKDYSGESDPFENFKAVEKLNISTVEQGLLTRIMDKVMRLKNLTQTHEKAVKTESLSDTLMDLAGYAILMKIYTENKKDE